MADILLSLIQQSVLIIKYEREGGDIRKIVREMSDQ